MISSSSDQNPESRIRASWQSLWNPDQLWFNFKRDVCATFTAEGTESRGNKQWRSVA